MGCVGKRDSIIPNSKAYENIDMYDVVSLG